MMNGAVVQSVGVRTDGTFCNEKIFYKGNKKVGRNLQIAWNIHPFLKNNWHVTVAVFLFSRSSEFSTTTDVYHPPILEREGRGIAKMRAPVVGKIMFIVRKNRSIVGEIMSIVRMIW